jgi:hypothetical protein
MPENPQLRLRMVLLSDLLTEQGLRLTNAFHKLQDVHDRQQVIALIEQLLDAQAARSSQVARNLVPVLSRPDSTWAEMILFASHEMLVSKDCRQAEYPRSTEPS